VDKQGNTTRHCDSLDTSGFGAFFFVSLASVSFNYVYFILIGLKNKQI